MKRQIGERTGSPLCLSVTYTELHTQGGAHAISQSTSSRTLDLASASASGVSAMTPAMMMAYTSNAELLEGVLGALDLHEFLFVRLMVSADAQDCTKGCTWGFSLVTTLKI